MHDPLDRVRIGKRNPGGHTEDLAVTPRIHQEPGLRGLLGHPRQRDVGEPMVRVLAADIGIKPNSA